MDDNRDLWIKARAYELWEAAGYPDGRHDEHWRQAEQEYADQHTEAKGLEPAGDADEEAVIGAKPVPKTA